MADPTQGQSQDFQLRPVQNPPPAPGDAPETPNATVGASPPPPIPSEAGMSSDGIVLAVAIIVLLGIVCLFVRGGVRSHLISGRAPLSAASTAGWALFAFLMSVTVLVVFGIVGNTFRLLAFTVPMGVLILATLIVAVITFRGATRRRR